MIPLTPTRVMVVDDDVAVLRSLTAYLEDEGFDVRSTSKAGDALKILAADAIDVAVVDVRLREMDGEQLVLRARAVRPATKYLIYTGSLGYQLPEALASTGMTQADVIYKPVKALSLIAQEIRRLTTQA